MHRVARYPATYQSPSFGSLVQTTKRLAGSVLKVHNRDREVLLVHMDTSILPAKERLSARALCTCSRWPVYGARRAVISSPR